MNLAYRRQRWHVWSTEGRSPSQADRSEWAGSGAPGHHPPVKDGPGRVVAPLGVDLDPDGSEPSPRCRLLVEQRVVEAQNVFLENRSEVVTSLPTEHGGRIGEHAG